MTERERPAYCGQCGNPVQPGDRFCGECGAAVLDPPPQAEQVISRPTAASQAPSRRSGRPLLLAVVLGALAVLLVGGGALALVGFGSGNNLLGRSEQNPPSASDNREVAPSQPKTIQEPLTSLAPTTSASPSSASSEEEQLKEFGREYYAATKREDWEATYAMLDESSQQKITEQEWADKQQALRVAHGTPAPLKLVSVQPNEQMSDSPATVTLNYQDGTQETMMAMVPMVVESGSDFSAKRYLTDQEISDIKQPSPVLPESTTSASPESTTNSYGLHPEGADQVREAVQNYYFAVDYEEWKSTYYNLDSESKALFTQEEWIKKNQWYADHENLKLDTMNIYVTMEGDNKAKVTVDRTFKDGTSISRETVFVWDNGWWKHHLTDEEIKIFRPDLSYEEFVQAQQ